MKAEKTEQPPGHNKVYQFQSPLIVEGGIIFAQSLEELRGWFQSAPPVVGGGIIKETCSYSILKSFNPPPPLSGGESASVPSQPGRAISFQSAPPVVGGGIGWHLSRVLKNP